MLFLTPIFFWILAFSDAKYEWVEFNEKYSWKKWLLITLGISLVIGCCNAWIKYYQYKDFYNYFKNLEYESDDKNIWVSDKINKEQKIIEDNLNNLDVNNNYLDVIWDNTICFYENWKININPEIDEDWNNINCYNKNWKKEWLRISFYGNWKKKTKSNYKNGKLNWEFVEYTYNWYIKLIRDYKDDKIINN